MNIGRGLLRLWIVLSILWVVLVGLFLAERVYDPSLPPATYYLVTVKQVDPPASGEPSTHFFEAKDRYAYIGAGETYEIAEFPENRRLLISKKFEAAVATEARKRFSKEFSSPRTAERRKVQRDNFMFAVQVAAIPPIALFLIGGALYWALSGFRQRRPR